MGKHTRGKATIRVVKFTPNSPRITNPGFSVVVNLLDQLEPVRLGLGMDDEVKAAAQLLGAIGGKRNTTRQNQARAQNGKRGGRPRKSTDKIVLAKPERSGNVLANE